MDKSLYSRRSNLVIGFHGCDKTVVDAVVAGKTDLLSSTNDYDWLGNGIEDNVCIFRYGFTNPYFYVYPS